MMVGGLMLTPFPIYTYLLYIVVLQASTKVLFYWNIITARIISSAPIRATSWARAVRALKYLYSDRYYNTQDPEPSDKVPGIFEVECGSSHRWGVNICENKIARVNHLLHSSSGLSVPIILRDAEVPPSHAESLADIKVNDE